MAIFQFGNCFSITRLGKPPFSYGFPMKTSIFLWFSRPGSLQSWKNVAVGNPLLIQQRDIPYIYGGLYWWMGSNVNITYNGYLMLILILLVITSEYCYVWFAKGSLKIGDALPVDALMWLKQCHKPSPSHHHFYRWYGYHSQMGGLWHCFIHSYNGYQ